MKKVLKIVLITLFGLSAVFIVMQSTQSKDSIPLSANEQLSPDDTGRKSEFLLLHKTLDELSKTWPEDMIKPYRKAVKKFPDVDACLITPKNADSINWQIIKTTIELKVCLSRIHTYLGDVHESEEWFKRQGFKVIVYDYPPDALPYLRHRINASWPIPSSGPLKDRKSPMSGIRIYFEELFAIAGVGVGVEISPEGKVVHVIAGYSRK